MNIYDPESSSSREELAIAIVAALSKAGFSPLSLENCNEAVYARTAPHPTGRVQIRVYTTVIKRGTSVEVRRSGKDAIRVAVVYASERPGLHRKERGLGKETRVNRTGTSDAIIERMLTRMRSAWLFTKNELTTCDQCSAPSFRTQNDRMCCCDLCFKSDEQLGQPYQKWDNRNRRFKRRRNSTDWTTR